MYNSFYGGKQGHSYNIVAHYDSIYDMVLAFQNGGNYTDVAFDEYVIIDTIVNLNKKNSPENGLIYRRGYDFSQGFYYGGSEQTTLNLADTISTTLYANTLNVAIESTSMPTSGLYSVENVTVPRFYNFEYKIIADETSEEENYEVVILNQNISFKEQDWISAWKAFVTAPGGGAIYVGQIVGAAGGTAALKMVTWEEFQANVNDNWQLAPYLGADDIVPVPGYDANKQNEDGYDNEGFFDKIQFGYCTLKDENDNVTEAYIAFNMPYTVFNFEAHGIAAYPPTTAVSIGGGRLKDEETGIIYQFNTNTRLWEYDNLVSENEDSIDHKFYKHYDIRIPKGVHGQTVEDLFISNNENEYIDPTQNLNIIPTQNKRSYKLKYRVRNFDEQTAGVISNPIEIGAYNVITQLTRQQVNNPLTPPDARYDHNLDSGFTFNYTAHEPDIFTHQVIERMWVQDKDENLPVYPANENKTLLNNHLYVLYSNYTLPVDLGVMNEIIAVWNESEGSTRPIGYTLTNIDNNGNVLMADYNYLITTGNRDANGKYIPICLGLTKKVIAIDRLENIPSQNVFEFTSYQAICADCSSLNTAARKTRCYKYNDNYYFYNPDDIDLPITVENFDSNFKLANNLGQFYTYFNDKTTTVLPITEVEQIALDGDLLLIRFRNLDYSNVHFPASMLREYNGETFINLGSVVKGNHVYTNYQTLDELILEHPNGLDNEDGNTTNRAGWVVTVGHDTDIVVRQVIENNEVIAIYPVASTDAIVVEENGNKTIVYPEGSIYDPLDPPTNLAIEEAVGYKLFAYDYRAAKWYAMQDLSGTAIKASYSVLVAKEDTQAINEPDDENKNYLNDGGVWFVVTE